jgi:formate dehydrogenase maturation protein FdhE
MFRGLNITYVACIRVSLSYTQDKVVKHQSANNRQGQFMSATASRNSDGRVPIEVFKTDKDFDQIIAELLSRLKKNKNVDIKRAVELVRRKVDPRLDKAATGWTD